MMTALPNFIKRSKLHLAVMTVAISLSLYSAVQVPAFAATGQPSLTFKGCTIQGKETITQKPYNGMPASNSTDRYYTTEKAGNTNSCVTSLQTDLNIYGRFCVSVPMVAIPTNGVYGAQTIAAVKKFQSYGRGFFLVNNVAVSVNGMAGPQTWGLIRSNDCIGDTSD
jgi:hypothetical protein